MILELLALSAGVSAVAVFLARRKRRNATDAAADAHATSSEDAKPPANRAAKNPGAKPTPTKPTGAKPAKNSAHKSAAPSAEGDAPRGLRIDDVVLYADTEDRKSVV